MYICSCLVVSLHILSRFASSRQPDTMWSIVSSCLLHRLHIGSVPSFIFLANFGPVLRLLFLLFQLLVQCIWSLGWSHFGQHLSASLVLFGYLPWSAFFSQCFDSLSWALCFAFCFVLLYICSGLLIFPFSRSCTSSSCLNFSTSFWIECNFLIFLFTPILWVLFSGQLLPGWGLFHQMFWVGKVCLYLSLGSAFFGC